MAKMTNIFDLFEVSPEDDKMKKEIQGSKSLSINKLKPFLNHPFKLYQGDRLKDMIESIKAHGIITPVIVRPLDDGYEILSGHNRINAAKLANIENVPVIIKENLTDDEAMLIVTETNLIQRSFTDLSYSERARVLTEHYKAIKEQGKRIDLEIEISAEKQRKIDIINEIEMLSNPDKINENLDLGQIGPNAYSREKVASSYDLSPRAVSRYLRIDTLINSLKERIDNSQIPFISGVDLSFLKDSEQETVEDILASHGFKIDLKKSEALKEQSQNKKLTYEKAYSILSGKNLDKPKKVKAFKVSPKIASKYFKENQTQREIEGIIDEALNQYFSKDQ
ncbi:MAG: chromosome partitioning protein ParB [Firmicutes bacterium HGW-Firmicutes-7]|nr:MAG: chromosome partitioning protein ParB [Firmicutes bacterium HGW-Firmicutes-7]